MNKNRIIILFTIITLLIGSFAVFAYASSGCPKGKACMSRGCRLYTDQNGNSLCDLAEADQALSDSNVTVSSGNTEAAVPSQSESLTQPSSESSIEQIYSPEQSLVSSQESEQKVVESAETDDNLGNSSIDSQPAQTAETAQNSEKSILAYIKENILIIFYGLFLLIATIISKIKSSRKTKRILHTSMLISSVALLGFYFGGCICPIGSLQNLPLKFAGVVSGMYISWLILFILPILFVFIAGRIFCSSVCPIGAVSELLFMVGKKLNIAKDKTFVDKISWLRYIKYAVLAWIIIFTAITGYTYFCQYDPFATLFALSGSIFSMILLALVLISSMFISRPWCRIICPYGALLGIANHFFGKKLNIGCKNCNGCNTCVKNCPVDAIKPELDDSGKASYKIDSYECINCNKCQF